MEGIEMTTLEMVQEFHTKYKRKAYQKITVTDQRLNKFRTNLLQEELDELKIALHDMDEVEVLDALLDLQYVLDGAFVAFGMAGMKAEGFQQVHNSNMTKENANENDDGYAKIQKGPNFRPPELWSVIISHEKQMH